MAELKNRSLERGLVLMETLSAQGACSLADLHRETGLPKTTIRRLLATLIGRNVVRRSLADGKYRINVPLPVNGADCIPQEAALMADRAMPFLVELTRKVGWPSDLHIVDGYKIRIVDSTRPLSPFRLYDGVVNRKLNIFGSATGLACLALKPQPEITAFVQRTRGDPIWGLSRFSMSMSDFRAQVRATRKRGYGVRLATSLGETPFEDGLSAIAVPILCDKVAVGAINLLYPRKYLGHEAFADRHLGDLKDTADRISAEVTSTFQDANDDTAGGPASP